MIGSNKCSLTRSSLRLHAFLMLVLQGAAMRAFAAIAGLLTIGLAILPT
jgi:hypothetical protein